MVGFEYHNPDFPFAMGGMFHGQVGLGGGVDNHLKSIQTRSGIRVLMNDADKAGLEHTVPDDGNFDEDTSKFYYRLNDELKIVPCTDCSFNYGPGCYLSTSEDLVRLGNSYLYADRILSKETFKELLVPRDEDKTYALGFITGRDFYRNYYFGHGGAYPGGMSDLRIYPKERLVVSVLINIYDNDIRLNQLLDEIIFQYLELIKKEG